MSVKVLTTHGHPVAYTDEELREIAFEEKMEKVRDSGFIIIFVPLLFAYIATVLAKRSMRSVKKGTSAKGYVAPDGFELLTSNDLYTHTETHTVTRTKSKSSGRSSGGGGFSSSRDSSYSGSSGKF